MKRHSSFSILLLAACLMVSLTAASQNKTVVYGSLGIENVNISVSNSPMGTSTDVLGRYSLTLHDRTKPVKLHYSCIGYNDTIVSLSPKQLQHDSVNISFSMRKQNYDLQEVTVTAKPKLYGERYYFMDFEVFDKAICILAACPDKQTHCLIMTDEDLRGFDTIHLPERINPERLLRDCMGNCQLVAADSVYEIGLTTNPHYIIASERSFFFSTMSDCLFASGEHIYFREKGMQGYYTTFYRVNLETKEPQLLFTSDLTDNYTKYWDDMKFHIAWKSANPRHHVAPIGTWSRQIKNHWFRPSDAELLLANDTLLYFEQSLGSIQRYDLEANIIDSCAIRYPFMEGWRHTLYQDLTKNKFYTIIKDQLFEIDPATGNITAKTTLIPSLYPKIVINSGQLLLLKKVINSSGERITFIERRKL